MSWKLLQAALFGTAKSLVSKEVKKKMEIAFFQCQG